MSAHLPLNLRWLLPRFRDETVSHVGEETSETRRPALGTAAPETRRRDRACPSAQRVAERASSFCGRAHGAPSCSHMSVPRAL